MKPHTSRMPKTVVRGALILAMVALGCDASTDPTGPEGSEGTAVVTGTVASAPAAATSGPATHSGGDPDLSGVVVQVDGSATADTTDANGTFRLEVPAGTEPLRIRFRSGGVEATLTLEGLPPGTILRIRVRLEAGDANLDDAEEGELAEFEGRATLASVTGAEPARTLALDVVHEGGVTRVRVDERATALEADRDLVTFGALVAALDLGFPVEVEGEGRIDANGEVDAARIKAETEEDVPGAVDFHGEASFVSVSGVAPQRVVRLEVTHETDTVLVEVAEGRTVLDNEGDFTAFADLLAAVQNATQVRVEGDGELQADRSILAHDIKAETDD